MELNNFQTNEKATNSGPQEKFQNNFKTFKRLFFGKTKNLKNPEFSFF